MQELLDYAASSQDEVCALILNDERVFRCRNVHPEPWHHFRIRDDDWLAAEEEGEITAVFHSHPKSQPALSGADRQMQLMTGLPWWLASGGQLRKFRPVPHLQGRKFEHGIMDCYTLFRDAYHLCGIDLPDFVRTNGWWLREKISIWLTCRPMGSIRYLCRMPDQATSLSGSHSPAPTHATQ